MRYLVDTAKKLFRPQSDRSALLKKNIVLSTILSIISMLISFWFVPVSIDFVSPSLYGIWLTISSLLSWFVFFEIGLGSGLRNKLTEALANKDMIVAKQLVSTTYILLVFIITIVAIFFFAVNPFIDWCKILNVSYQFKEQIDTVVVIVFGFFFLNFVLKLISNILGACQLLYLDKLITTIGQIICFVVLLVATYFIKGDLIILSLILCVIPVIVLIIGAIYLFRSKLKEFSPSIKFANRTMVNGLIGMGFKFFTIQLALLVVNSSANLIISNRLGHDEVVVYNVGYKLFSIAQIFFTIIIAPTWAAYSDAIVKNDFEWVDRMTKKMKHIWLIITGSMFLILISSPLIYKVWIGNRVEIPFLLSCLFFVHFSILTYGGIFNMFVNATGRLKVQQWMWLFIAIIFVPFVFFLLESTNLGIYCIVIGLLFADLYYIIVPFQYKRFFKLMTNNK